MPLDPEHYFWHDDIYGKTEIHIFVSDKTFTGVQDVMADLTFDIRKVKGEALFDRDRKYGDKVDHWEVKVRLHFIRCVFSNCEINFPKLTTVVNFVRFRDCSFEEVEIYIADDNDLDIPIVWCDFENGGYGMLMDRSHYEEYRAGEVIRMQKQGWPYNNVTLNYSYLHQDMDFHGIIFTPGNMPFKYAE